MPASYDWTGVRYEWRTPSKRGRRAALDVERLDTSRPKFLVPSGWTMTAFLAAWTRAEVMAKLFDVPIPVWIRANPLKTVTLGRWSEETGAGVSHCRVFTGVDHCAGITFSCGWVMLDRENPQRPRCGFAAISSAGRREPESADPGGLHDDES